MLAVASASALTAATSLGSPSVGVGPVAVMPAALTPGTGFGVPLIARKQHVQAKAPDDPTFWCGFHSLAFDAIGSCPVGMPTVIG